MKASFSISTRLLYKIETGWAGCMNRPDLNKLAGFGTGSWNRNTKLYTFTQEQFSGPGSKVMHVF